MVRVTRKLDKPETRATVVVRRTSQGGSFGAREGACMPPAERSTAHADRDDRERQKAVELALGQIEKQFGKGSIMRLGQKGPISRSTPSPPAPSASTTPWASAVCQGAALLRSSGLS